MKIQSTRGVGTDRVKGILFAESGHGKTHRAKDFTDPTLVVSFESGLLPLKDSDIDYIDCTVDDNGNVLSRDERMKKLAHVYEYLTKEEARKKYTNIYLDSLTEISDCLFFSIEKRLLAEAQESGKKGDVWGVYKEFKTRIVDLCTRFRDLPGYNVWFTCLVKEKDDDNGVTKYRLALPGEASQQAIPPLFDEILFLRAFTDKESGELKREIFTKGVDAIPNLKDRSGALEKVEPANLQLIMDKIKGIKAKTKETK
jgi:hypothetical protein